jgi:hypothetical protein
MTQDNTCMPSKEDLLVCDSKLEHLSCIGVMLLEFCKSLFVMFLHHALGSN